MPDDAAVVVVADPTAPLPPNAVEAIRKFMNKPRPGGKKGKLIVLAGARPAPTARPLQTGLEPVLGDVRGPAVRRVLVRPAAASSWATADRANGTPRQLGEIHAASAVEAGNPVALEFNKAPLLPMLDCREVTAGPGPGSRRSQCSATQRGRPTWMEAVSPDQPGGRVAEVDRAGPADRRTGRAPAPRRTSSNRNSIAQKQMTRRPRDLAVFVSEPSTTPNAPPAARVAVFGCGWFVSDDAGGRAPGVSRGQAPTLWLDLMGSTLDWIRDRPVVSGMPEKPYTTYTLKPGYDDMRHDRGAAGPARVLARPGAGRRRVGDPPQVSSERKWGSCGGPRF